MLALLRVLRHLDRLASVSRARYDAHKPSASLDFYTVFGDPFPSLILVARLPMADLTATWIVRRSVFLMTPTLLR